MSELAVLLKMLSHDTRLQILNLLLRQESCVSELSSGLGLAQATISQHLKILRERGLLCSRREGKYVYYSCLPDIAEQVSAGLVEFQEVLVRTTKREVEVPHNG